MSGQAGPSMQQTLSFASSTASNLLPRAVWRHSSTTLSTDSGIVGIVCSSCQEPRETNSLLILPDAFRCNRTSSYVCISCHQYIGDLLSVAEVNTHTLEAWNFQPTAPVNVFDIYTKKIHGMFGQNEEDEKEIMRCLPFVPKLVIDMSMLGTTFLDFEEATVVIIDVSGYTALAEQLKGSLGEGSVIGQASGAEALVSEGLNHYFQTLVENVHTYGGDVIKFAGDALICLFNAIDSSGDSLRIAARNAVFCATSAAQTMTHTVHINSNSSKLLTCHCGVATGRILAWSVGDYERRELLLTGGTLATAGDALDKAGAHTVVIDKRTYALVGEWIVSADIAMKEGSKSDGSRHQSLEKAKKLLGGPITGVLPRVNTKMSLLQDFYKIDCITAQAFVTSTANLEAVTKVLELKTLQTMPATLLSFVGRHVPKPAKGPSVMNEMRRVTTVFTKLFQVGLVENKVPLQDLFKNCQRIVSSLGGLIRQFIVDDKGCVLISVFGVASFTDEDDSTRALSAAARLAHGLEVPTSSGVATGVVFVGVVGWADVRCEFAVVGDSVNLSARLMSLAAKFGEGEVRCDEATAAASSDKVVFTELEPVMLKGKSQPTRIFVPSLSRNESSQFSFNSLSSNVSVADRVRYDDDLIGRDEEKQKIQEFITEARAEQPSVVGPPIKRSVAPSLMFVSGRNGLGKSRLLTWIENQAKDDMCVLRGKLNASLAQWVEMLALKSISSGRAPATLEDEADTDAVRALIAEKLRERRYRNSLASVSLEDTPSHGVQKANPGTGNRRMRRRSVSFTSSPAMPLSPSALAGRRDIGTRAGIGQSMGVQSNLRRSPQSRDESGFDGMSWGREGDSTTSPRSVRGLSSAMQQSLLLGNVSSIMGMYAVSTGYNDDSSPSLPVVLKGHSTESVLEWLFGADTMSSGILQAGAEMHEITKYRVLESLFISFVRDLVGIHRLVLLLLDDADQASDPLVRAALASSKESNVLVIATGRSDDARLGSTRRRAALHLGPLNAEDIKAVVRERFGFESCPDSVWEFVVKGGQGNPQLACDYFRALLRQQFVVHSAGIKGAFELSPGKTDDDLSKVTPLEGSILNSFDTSLTSQEKEIIRKCAVVCSSDEAIAFVNVPLLRYLESSDNPAEDPTSTTKLVAIVAKLCGSMTSKTSSNASTGEFEGTRAYLISKDPSGQGAEMLFANEIVRSVIYRTMTFAERSQVHLKVALWLQATRGWDLLAVPLIVHHLVSGGERRQAFEFLWSISSLLLKEGPFGDAIMFMKRALDLVPALQQSEMVEPREVFELKVALTLAQSSREGRISKIEAVLEMGTPLPRRPASTMTSAGAATGMESPPVSPGNNPPSTTLDRKQSRLSKNSEATMLQPRQNSRQGASQQPGGTEDEVVAATTSDLHGSRWRLAPSPKWLLKSTAKPIKASYEAMFGSKQLSDAELEVIRIGSIAQILCAFGVLGDATIMSDAFAKLSGTIPASVAAFPSQKLFLKLLSAALSAPLRGKGKTRLDVGILEKTADMALQLASPELVGLGTWATAQALLLLRQPFAAERVGRNSLMKLKEASHGGALSHRIVFSAAAPTVHCLKLIAVSQTLCGGLAGARQSIEQCREIAEKLELIKLVAWAECSEAVLRFKTSGRIPSESRDDISPNTGTATNFSPASMVASPQTNFDWQALSDIDALVAWTGRALCSRQERDWFVINEDSLEVLRLKRFSWWLVDCFEGAIYCGLLNRAGWTMSLLGEFFSFARNTLQVALPIVFRLEAIARAQRGEDVLALKAIRRARNEARSLNLLYEAHICEFIYKQIFSDEVDQPEMDFTIFGCERDFTKEMKATVAEWISPSLTGMTSPDRWALARRKRDKGGLRKMAANCFGLEE